MEILVKWGDKQMRKRLVFALVALLFATAFFAGKVAALSIEEVETMAAELAAEDVFSQEIISRYIEYRQQRLEVIAYEVVKGDTLIGIAEKYGISLATITANNQIENPNLILVGQWLYFPPVSGLVYTVRAGDNLKVLAKKYEVEWESIWFANSLITDSLLPGSQLIIPGAKLPAPRVSTSLSRSEKGANPKLAWPFFGPITSYYGIRKGSFHRGIDISGKTGAPIYAAAAGTVTSAGWGGTYGYMVQLQHQYGTCTLYAHASKLCVTEGDWVAQGDVIAYLGSTGKSTGPHLHFELRINGKAVNPLSHLP